MVDEFALTRWLAEACLEIGFHLRLALFAFLCGDQHDAVGGAGAIDSPCRSIFQDFDGFDIVEVEVGQRVQGGAEGVLGLGRDGNPVNDIQRLVARGNGGSSPDAHPYGTARFPVHCFYKHPGGTALEGLFYARDRQVFDFLPAQSGDIARQGRFDLGAVSDHDHLRQLCGRLVQSNIHHIGNAQGYFLGRVASIAEHQGCHPGRDAQ